MVRSGLIFLLSGALVIAAAAPAPKGKPRKRDGGYDFDIAGFIQGSGQASVAGNKLSFKASVKSESGSSGDFVADNVNIQGNHFSGSGTVIGVAVTVRGRIDSPELDKEQTIKLSRLTGVISTADGKYAKLIGSLPGSDQPPTSPDLTPDPSPGGAGGGSGSGGGSGAAGGSGSGGGASGGGSGPGGAGSGKTPRPGDDKDSGSSKDQEHRSGKGGKGPELRRSR